MDDEDKLIDVYLDLRPNQPRNDQGREVNGRILRQVFDDRFDQSVERVWDLPPIVLSRDGAYLPLLVETRELYLFGLFYSCVAMCGIVGERLVKDAFRSTVVVRRDTDFSVEVPTDDAFDQLERVDTSGILRFLHKVGVLSADASKAARDLAELRNRYAHARGSDAQGDALKAIKFLHELVEDTVSIFKAHRIQDGRLVPK